MPAPLFLLLLAGGGYALYRHLNPERPPRAVERVTVNGRTYELRPGLSFTDVIATGGLPVLLVRYHSDTRRALTWAKNAEGLTAMADLGISTT